MAAVSEEHCAKESDLSSPFNVSYFTLYLTRGIEVLEYYTKVSFCFPLFYSERLTHSDTMKFTKCCSVVVSEYFFFHIDVFFFLTGSILSCSS